MLHPSNDAKHPANLAEASDDEERIGWRHLQLYGGTVTLKSTLIANNTVPIGGSGPDLSGTFNSQDYNLIENTNGATINSVMTHNLTGDILKMAPGLRCPQELFARPRSVWSP